MKEKVVLAFSGGLDTSFCVPYLKNEKGFEGFNPEHPLTPLMEGRLERVDPDYASKSDIKWNFTKFLIDREGNVVKRFEPTEDIEVVEESVKELL